MVGDTAGPAACSSSLPGLASHGSLAAAGCCWCCRWLTVAFPASLACSAALQSRKKSCLVDPNFLAAVWSPAVGGCLTSRTSWASTPLAPLPRSPRRRPPKRSTFASAHCPRLILSLSTQETAQRHRPEARAAGAARWLGQPWVRRAAGAVSARLTALLVGAQCHDHPD